MAHTAPIIRKHTGEDVGGYGESMWYSTYSYEVCEYRETIAEVEYVVVGKDDEGADIEEPRFYLDVVHDGIRSTEVYHSTESLVRRIDEMLANG